MPPPLISIDVIRFWIVLSGAEGASATGGGVTVAVRGAEYQEETTVSITSLAASEVTVLKGAKQSGAHRAFYRELYVPHKARVESLSVTLRSGSPLVSSAVVAVDVREYQQQMRLQYPVTGTSIVESGHETADAHCQSPGQMFAWDIVPVLADGTLLAGSAAAGFGRPVTAPADGIAVKSVDGRGDREMYGPVSEWELGTFRENPDLALGNHLVIRHSETEFSLLAHLQKGTIQHRPGDCISAGDAVGAVGNSGNSNFPHLHYALLAGPEPLADMSLPAQLSGWEPAIANDAFGPVSLVRGAFVRSEISD